MRVVDILGDFEVAFAARRARVVIGMAEALQLVLIHQVMADAAERVDDAVVLALEDDFGDLDLHDLLAHAQVDLEVLVQPPGGRQRGAFLAGPSRRGYFCTTWCIR